MVSDKVTVVSKAYGEDVAYEWESTGADGYTIKDCEKEGNGTEITLLLKADTEDENYSQYLETYQIKNLINKYSDYIRYPIQMMVEHQKLKEGTENEYETYSELETLNSMIPLWKKNKSELKDEDYNQFYKEKFYDFTDPAKVIHTNVEGVVSYTALLFIPGQAPYNYYTKEFEKGLQLYSSGVLIMEKCADLLPDYFSFVRGLGGLSGSVSEYFQGNAAARPSAEGDCSEAGKENQERAAFHAEYGSGKICGIFQELRSAAEIWHVR